ncbi:MAG: radical SAM protein [Chloroflexi bacterium]|nr:radical SAM protein [Chloroflexota bacterium]
MTGPIYVDWAITNVCNLKCRHCVGMEDLEVAHSEAMRIAREIIELAPRWVILEGGEPLLRSDLPEIGTLLKDNGIDVFVITNGNAFTQERLEKLASFSPRVLFSIDSANAPVYRYIKGGAKLDVAREWAEKCAELGIFQGITVVLSKLNLKQVVELIELTEELGGQNIIFLPLKPFGDDERARRYYLQYALSPGEQEDAIKEIYGYNTRLDIFYDEPFLWNIASKHNLSVSSNPSGIIIPEVVGCAASYSLYIQTNGDVRPCMFSPKELSFGSAVEEPLGEIWQRMQESDVLTAWCDQGERKGACGGCPQFESCRGCLARTVRLCADAREADPICPLAARSTTLIA